MNPILIDIPVPIQTKRLIIRPPVAGDGPELNAAVRESFKELRLWMPWATENPSLESSEINVREAGAQWILRKDLRLSIFDKASGRLAGSTGFHRMQWDVPRLEIGYWARTSFAGKGYISEAVCALTAFAFSALKARRLEIRCDADNGRSAAIPRRLGFELEATLKGDEVKEHSDVLRHTLVFVRFDARGLPDVGATW